MKKMDKRLAIRLGALALTAALLGTGAGLAVPYSTIWSTAVEESSSTNWRESSAPLDQTTS